MKNNKKSRKKRGMNIKGVFGGNGGRDGGSEPGGCMEKKRDNNNGANNKCVRMCVC